jgi:hypothetical protein
MFEGQVAKTVAIFSMLAFMAGAPGGLVACGGGGPAGPGEAQEAPLVSGIKSMVKRPDGRFDVTCDNGRIEVVTADQIRQDDVCLGQGPGGGPTPSAIGRFVCNSSANLDISIVNAAGTEKQATVSIGTFDRCNNIANALNSTRRDIVRTALFGVCDSSANLRRFAVMPTGDLQTLAVLNIGTFDGCDAQAAIINGPVSTAPGDAAIGSFSCNSSANLEISIVGSVGTEQRATIRIGTFDRCNQAANTLNGTRRDIRRMTLLGVCDSSANLEQFSVTPVGDLHALSTLNIGIFDRCDAQAADLDR